MAERELVLFGSMTICTVDYATMLSAVSIQKRHQLPYWDTQIFASAVQDGCMVLCPEDLQDGGFYDNVEARNPFGD